MGCKNLEEVRENIDRIDTQLVRLLAERCGYVKQAAGFKKSREDVVDSRRVEAIIRRVRELSAEHGANPDLMEKLYREMIAAFTRFEADQFGD